MSWRDLWSGPWNTLSQPAIYSFVGRLIQRKLIKLCAKWIEEKEVSKGFLHSNSLFIMTLKHACNILQVHLHLLFLSVLRSVPNFPFVFPSYCVSLLFFPFLSVFIYLSFFCVISLPFPSDSILLRCLFFFLFLFVGFFLLFEAWPPLIAVILRFFPLSDKLLNIRRLKLTYIIYNGLVPTSQRTDHFY